MSEETKEVKEEEKIDEVKTESNDNIEKTTTVVKVRLLGPTWSKRNKDTIYQRKRRKCLWQYTERNQ